MHFQQVMCLIGMIERCSVAESSFKTYAFYEQQAICRPILVWVLLMFSSRFSAGEISSRSTQKKTVCLRTHGCNIYISFEPNSLDVNTSFLPLIQGQPLLSPSTLPLTIS